MRAFIAVATAFFACMWGAHAGAAGPDSTPSPPPPTSCDSDIGARACGGDGQVIVGIGKKHVGRPPSIPILTSVQCGPGTAAALQLLPDRNSAADAALCVNLLAKCLPVAKDGVEGPFTGAQLRLRRFGGEWIYDGSGCTRPAQPQVTAAMVAAQARRLIPVAAVGVAPEGRTLVNIQTLLWADAHDQTLAPVTLLGRRVVITIKLDHVAWDFGDGAADARGPAGKAYDPTGDPCRAKLCPHYYGHVYTKTGEVTVRATASWQASFTVDGGRAIAIPGLIDGPLAQAQLLVREARGVLVPN